LKQAERKREREREREREVKKQLFQLELAMKILHHKHKKCEKLKPNNNV
jgi:hypothetical protein